VDAGRRVRAAEAGGTTGDAAAVAGVGLSGEEVKRIAGMGFEPDLRRFTPARVALGQAGPAVPTREQLRFQLDHALARDAVHARLDVNALLRELGQRGMGYVALRSAVSEAAEPDDRSVYLRRPDLGRRLDGQSAQKLQERAANLAVKPDVVLVIADGLSALAVERHAMPLVDEIKAAIGAEKAGPVCVVSDGRVAIGDEIGFLLGARIAIVLIGERPGLSSPDSLGAYITWEPKPGRTDAERNCISNVRGEGLSYREAAQRVAYYLSEAKRLGTTGVLLKERAGRELS
jgi:ethanolamine ammonia-lyase small subunit